MKVSILIPKYKYRLGEIIEIDINLNSAPELLEDLSNLNISITSLGVKRNDLVITFGERPVEKDGIIKIRKELPKQKDYGICFISRVRLLYGDNHEKQIDLIPPKNIPLTFFWLTDKENIAVDQENIKYEVEAILKERMEYTEKLIVTEQASNNIESSRNYRVLIFAVGLLVHAKQQLEGYSIIPLKEGFDYKHMLSVVNKYVSKVHGFELPYQEQIARDFSSSTPIILIDFRNIQAIDLKDAFIYCLNFTRDIFTVIAYDEGIRPNQFATIIIDLKSSEVKHTFHFPGYYGNIITPFNPFKTANHIERWQSLLERSPWLNLLLRGYGEALTEENLDYAILRLWTTLEYIAYNRVPDDNIILKYPDGEKIVYDNGELVKTKHALGKVYWWVYQNCHTPSTVTDQRRGLRWRFEMDERIKPDENIEQPLEIISLWDSLSTFYEIRNAAAHEGRFNPSAASNGSSRKQVASRLYSLEKSWLLREYQRIVKHIIQIEIEREASKTQS